MAEPRGLHLRPEGGEVVVEVAALGGEDGGGDTLGERPGIDRGRGASARGVAVGGDEEVGGVTKAARLPAESAAAAGGAGTAAIRAGKRRRLDSSWYASAGWKRSAGKREAARPRAQR